MNPAAGRGRARRRIEAARLALSRVGPFDMVVTEAPGDETQHAADAVRDGIDVLAVLGGDGTVHRVCAPLAGTRCALAVLSAGTGNDFAKSLGTPSRDIEAMARFVARGETRQVDLGDVNGRVFANALGVGFDAAVLHQRQHARWQTGDLSYAAAALGQLRQYPGVSVAVDDQLASRWLMIVVANGQHFGGIFHIAPLADVADGKLDVVAVRDASTWRRLQLFAAAPRGRHMNAPEVHAEQRINLVLRFDEPPLYDADGELYLAETRELNICIRPGALRVVV